MKGMFIYWWGRWCWWRQRGEWLRSQTVRPALQELTALVLAQALVARVRTARRERTTSRSKMSTTG